MDFLMTAIMGLLVTMPATEALDKPESLTPAEIYRNTVEEHQQQLRNFQTALANAKSDEERQASFLKNRPDDGAFAERFWKLAQDHPDDPAAIDALIWVATRRQAPLCDRALDLLLEKHIQSEKLGPICHHLAYSADRQSDGRDAASLRRIFAENPHREVKGAACFELGGYLKRRAAMIREAKQAPPDVLARAEAEHGKEAIRSLMSQDTEGMKEEAVRLFELALDQYGDIKYYFGKPGTLADAARPQLHEIRNLAVGGIAPEIAGEGLGGDLMRLVDYRGKVVVLSFWASWCGPCMEMVPHERSLVERLKGRPFVLLGVNGDENRDEAKLAVEREKIIWNSWWGAGQAASIITAWNVDAWPTIYVLDAQGVIRYKNLRGKQLDDAVDALLAEMGR